LATIAFISHDGITMKPRLILVALLAAALIAVVLFMIRSVPQEVSLLLVNGVVYTLQEEKPLAEAVAIRGDRIVGVGSTAELQSEFQAKQVIDLHGRSVYPGFTDAHAHLENLGAALMHLRLSDASSAEDVAARVAEGIKDVPPGGWLRGRGWDQNRWASRSFPHRSTLDAVARDVPVYLTRVDGHAVWVNSAALRIAGISAATPDPEGGRIVRDTGGEPTGVFVDNAIDLLRAQLPPPTEEERTRAVERAIQECLKVGLTEVHDMGVDLEGIGIYRKLISQGRFPFRVYAAIDGAGETWEHFKVSGADRGDGRLTIRAIKLYADGALGSRGAALIEPYADDPGNRGLTLLSSEEIRKVALDALRLGFQVCTHAIGDRANHIVMNVYEDVLKSLPDKGKLARFRVEHTQVLDQTDIPRFRPLGVIPSMQPSHCTSDMYWAEDRLGPSRVGGAYAWRSLLDDGNIIPGGSDFPVEAPNPLWGFYAAITRQDQKGWPDGGWHPEQCMTRDEALNAYTKWAAYAAFEENTRGTIETGKLADIVVLSEDIMKIAPREIIGTSVRMTIVGGEVVYANDLLAGEELPPPVPGNAQPY
jgi:predicted amidohydrolase YtcJ